MRPAPALIAAALLCGSAAGVLAQAQYTACTKADFEAAVDSVAASLRNLNNENSPAFQSKLRQLKEKRGWSHTQFLELAEPFVRDDTIAGFDQKSEDFLLQVQSMGQEGAAAIAPGCALLSELKASMAALLATQKAKWAYMFEKIDKELAK
jgi:hypothetical protein